MTTPTTITWQEGNAKHSAEWHSENDARAPKTIQVIDDNMSADAAFKLACEGTGLLWQGDFQNGKLLLQAIKRRIIRPKKKGPRTPSNITEAFHFQRQAQSHQARILGLLLIALTPDNTIKLRRAPDVKDACAHAYGHTTTHRLVSLRELLGVIGAYEWHKKGMLFDDLPHTIYPAYGVFSPTRFEYLDLIHNTPLPENCTTAMDIGVGTGVISAILANRGVANIIATDYADHAIACAQRNLAPYASASKIQYVQTDTFPKDDSVKADLVVCNPPWLPARPSSTLEAAIYDEKSQMLKGFIKQAGQFLAPNGEVWLILSDLAEHLGLRTRAELEGWLEEGKLKVIETIDTKATHEKALNKADPLHAARKAEVTSLWRLTHQ